MYEKFICKNYIYKNNICILLKIRIIHLDFYVVYVVGNSTMMFKADNNILINYFNIDYSLIIRVCFFLLKNKNCTKLIKI